MVEDGAFSHKIAYVFKEIQNLEGHPNRTTGSKVLAILLYGWIFAYWWSFSGEGSASAACAAGLFLYSLQAIYMVKCEEDEKLHQTQYHHNFF